MPTEKQKSASRPTTAKTHGPTSPQPNRKSARNSFRQGLLAKAIVFEGESPKQFAALLNAFCDELQPQTHIEDLLVQKMAVNQWRQERLWGQEKAHAFRQTSPHETQPHTAATRPEESRIASLTTVSEMRYDRQFGRALDRLLQYRAAQETHQKLKFNGTNLGTN